MYGQDAKGSSKEDAMREAIQRRRGKGLDLMIAIGQPKNEGDLSAEHDIENGQRDEKGSDLAPSVPGKKIGDEEALEPMGPATAGKGGFPEGSMQEEKLESPAEEEMEMKHGIGDVGKKMQSAGKPGMHGEVEVDTNPMGHEMPVMQGKRMSLGQRASMMHGRK